VDRKHALRVLIANERPERLMLLADVLARLGHEVVASEVDVTHVAAVTARERPDVALVGLGSDPEHALRLVTEIISQAFCPVIALLEHYDGRWVTAAAAKGIFAYITGSDPDELQSALDISLRRYADYQALQGAFDRREAETLGETDRRQIRQREALELHDGVVQSLTVAHLALELDRRDESRDALLTALENTRGIIGRALAELQLEGVPLEELIRDSAPTRP